MKQMAIENILSGNNSLILLERLRDELKAKGKNYFHYINLKNDDITFSCPFHKQGKERKASAGMLLVNKDKYTAGSIHCFTCGYNGNLYTMVSELLFNSHLEEEGQKWVLKAIGNHNFVNREKETEELLNKLNNLGRDKEKSLYISEEELESYRYTHSYMYERHLTDEIIEKFDIGYQKDYQSAGRTFECITMPVKNANGKVITIIRRAIKQKRFFIEKNIEKPLYGLYEISKTKEQPIILVESIFNCLSLWGWGYQSIAMIGLGNKKQFEILNRLPNRKFIICFDGDEAGYNAAKKANKYLLKNNYIIKMWQGEDVNSISKEDFQTLYYFYVEEKNGLSK